jgi:hypothetical protein
MIHPDRIASGLVRDLLNAAKPATHPKALIADAFRRGVRLGLSIRVASRGCPTRALLDAKEPRHAPC